MTAYTAIEDTRIDTDSPLDTILAARWRDNPIGMAEGADGAPVIAAGWHPYDMVDVGDGADGVVYDNAVDGNQASVAMPDFEDGFNYRFLFDGLSATVGSAQFRIQLYKETGAAYSSAYTLHTFGLNSATHAGRCELLLPRYSTRFHWGRSEMEQNTTESIGSTTPNDFRLRLASADTILRAQFLVHSGSIDAGTIIMQRQREYLTG